jgi:hypothetical protein
MPEKISGGQPKILPISKSVLTRIRGRRSRASRPSLLAMGGVGEGWPRQCALAHMPLHGLAPRSWDKDTWGLRGGADENWAPPSNEQHTGQMTPWEGTRI